MANFSNHKLTDWSWVNHYRNKMGAEMYNSYTDMIWAELNKITPGGEFDISKNVRHSNLDLFIKTSCYFIQYHDDYSFTHDYSKIVRL